MPSYTLYRTGTDYRSPQWARTLPDESTHGRGFVRREQQGRVHAEKAGGRGLSRPPLDFGWKQSKFHQVRIETLATDVDSVCNQNAFLPDWKNVLDLGNAVKAKPVAGGRRLRRSARLACAIGVRESRVGKKTTVESGFRDRLE